MSQGKLSLEDVADKWVFETNGHKWSNNNDECGDNYGSFIAGARFRESQLMKIVNQMKTEIERISDESTHGDNCRHIIYQGIRDCDCHKPEIKQLLTNFNKALDERGIK